MGKVLEKYVKYRWVKADETHLTYEGHLPENAPVKAASFSKMKCAIMPGLKWKSRSMDVANKGAALRLLRPGSAMRVIDATNYHIHSRGIMFDIKYDIVINPQTPRESRLTDENVAFLFGCYTTRQVDGETVLDFDLNSAWDICESFKPNKWMTLTTFMTDDDLALADRYGFLY